MSTEQLLGVTEKHHRVVLSFYRFREHEQLAQGHTAAEAVEFRLSLSSDLGLEVTFG